jgi:hypothetical protein
MTSEKIKNQEKALEEATMTVYLKNYTVIDWETYAPWYTVLTMDQYKKIQQFL